MNLIDKATLLNKIATEVHYDTEAPLEAYGKLMSLINNAPTVDAEPVRHGHWVAEISDEEEYKCSECGDKEYYTCNYCPNCGARMDEVEEV